MLRKSIGAQRANCQIRQTDGLDASRLKNPQFLHKAINPTIDGERCEQLLKKILKTFEFIFMRVDLEREWGRLHERMQPTPFTLACSPLPFPSPSSSHPPPSSLPPPSLFPSPSLPFNSNKIIFSKPQSRTKN